MKRFARKLPEFLFALLATTCLHAQPAADMKRSLTSENYILRDAAGGYTFTPLLQYESLKGWYLEARFNYEDLNTVSLFGGKIIDIGSETGEGISGDMKPIIGVSVGNFTGMSLGVNSDLEWKRFYFSTQTQVTTGFKMFHDFFYTWTELGAYISCPDNKKLQFYGGGVVQHTRQKPGNETDIGIVVSPEYTFGKRGTVLGIPLYFFRPFRKDAAYMVGVNIAFTW